MGMIMDNRKRLILLTLSFGLQLICDAKNGKNNGVINKPVIDLFIDLPIQASLPPAAFSDAIGTHCRRVHQGLFNERVTIVAVQGDFVQISFDNVVYGIDEKTGKPLSTFWAKKRDIMFLGDTVSEELFPPPFYVHDASVLVLIRPFEEYSLATRFVRAPAFDKEDSYAVKRIDVHTLSPHLFFIPKSHAEIEKCRSKKQMRAAFVHLAYDIIDYADGQNGLIVPYVWGGSSFVCGYEDAFEGLDKKWMRNGPNDPFMGYDCSEFVLRLAQICGIPYRWKTTVMLNQCGKEIFHKADIKEGDLIWVPGHVMIVSDLSNNELIESAGYESGFGKVQSISLEKRFAHIKTYDDLWKAYEAQQPLTILKKDGTVREVKKSFKFITLF
jgi:hypothetical protein